MRRTQGLTWGPVFALWQDPHVLNWLEVWARLLLHQLCFVSCGPFCGSLWIGCCWIIRMNPGPYDLFNNDHQWVKLPPMLSLHPSRLFTMSSIVLWREEPALCLESVEFSSIWELWDHCELQLWADPFPRLVSLVPWLWILDSLWAFAFIFKCLSSSILNFSSFWDFPMSQGVFRWVTLGFERAWWGLNTKFELWMKVTLYHSNFGQVFFEWKSYSDLTTQK